MITGTPAYGAAVFGNAGSMIVFRVGGEDAALLAPEFHPIQIVGLGRAGAVRGVGAALRSPAPSRLRRRRPCIRRADRQSASWRRAAQFWEAPPEHRAWLVG